MDSINSLLPGIRQFLEIDLARVNLPVDLEQKRQFYIDRFKVLSLGPVPTLPENGSTVEIPQNSSFIDGVLYARNELKSKRLSYPSFLNTEQSFSSIGSNDVSSALVEEVQVSAEDAVDSPPSASTWLQRANRSLGNHGDLCSGRPYSSILTHSDETRIDENVYETPSFTSPQHNLLLQAPNIAQNQRHSWFGQKSTLNDVQNGVTETSEMRVIHGPQEMLLHRNYSQLCEQVALEHSTITNRSYQQQQSADANSQTAHQRSGVSLPDRSNKSNPSKDLVLPKKTSLHARRFSLGLSSLEQGWTLLGSLSQRTRPSKWVQLNACFLTVGARLVGFKHAPRGLSGGHPSLCVFLCGAHGLYAGRDSGKEHVIKINGPSGDEDGLGTHVLAADSEREALLWIQQINLYAKGSTPVQTYSFLDTHSTTAYLTSAASPVTSLCEGPKKTANTGLNRKSSGSHSRDGSIDSSMCSGELKTSTRPLSMLSYAESSNHLSFTDSCNSGSPNWQSGASFNQESFLRSHERSGSSTNLSVTSRRSSLLTSVRKKVEQQFSASKRRLSMSSTINPMESQHKTLPPGQTLSALSSEKEIPSSTVSSNENKSFGFSWKQLNEGATLLTDATLVAQSGSTTPSTSVRIRSSMRRASLSALGFNFSLSSMDLTDTLPMTPEMRKQKHASQQDEDPEVIVSGEAQICIPGKSPWTTRWCRVLQGRLEIFTSVKKPPLDSLQKPLLCLSLQPNETFIDLAGDKRYRAALKLSAPKQTDSCVLFNVSDKIIVAHWIRAFIQALGMIPRQTSQQQQKQQFENGARRSQIDPPKCLEIPVESGPPDMESPLYAEVRSVLCDADLKACAEIQREKILTSGQKRQTLPPPSSQPHVLGVGGDRTTSCTSLYDAPEVGMLHGQRLAHPVYDDVCDVLHAARRSSEAVNKHHHRLTLPYNAQNRQRSLSNSFVDQSNNEGLVVQSNAGSSCCYETPMLCGAGAGAGIAVANGGGRWPTMQQMLMPSPRRRLPPLPASRSGSVGGHTASASTSTATACEEAQETLGFASSSRSNSEVHVSDCDHILDGRTRILLQEAQNAKLRRVLSVESIDQMQLLADMQLPQSQHHHPNQNNLSSGDDSTTYYYQHLPAGSNMGTMEDPGDIYEVAITHSRRRSLDSLVGLPSSVHSAYVMNADKTVIDSPSKKEVVQTGALNDETDSPLHNAICSPRLREGEEFQDEEESSPIKLGNSNMHKVSRTGINVSRSISCKCPSPSIDTTHLKSNCHTLPMPMSPNKSGPLPVPSSTSSQRRDMTARTPAQLYYASSSASSSSSSCYSSSMSSRTAASSGVPLTNTQSGCNTRPPSSTFVISSGGPVNTAQGNGMCSPFGDSAIEVDASSRSQIGVKHSVDEKLPLNKITEGFATAPTKRSGGKGISNVTIMSDATLKQDSNTDSHLRRSQTVIGTTDISSTDKHKYLDSAEKVTHNESPAATNVPINGAVPPSSCAVVQTVSADDVQLTLAPLAQVECTDPIDNLDTLKQKAVNIDHSPGCDQFAGSNSELIQSLPGSDGKAESTVDNFIQESNHPTLKNSGKNTRSLVGVEMGSALKSSSDTSSPKSHPSSPIKSIYSPPGRNKRKRNKLFNGCGFGNPNERSKDDLIPITTQHSPRRRNHRR